jgi:hypothetical protein
MAVIEATPAQLDALRADAAHYASDAMDDCPAWLRRSARAAALHLSRAP